MLTHLTGVAALAFKTPVTPTPPETVSLLKRMFGMNE